MFASNFPSLALEVGRRPWLRILVYVFLVAYFPCYTRYMRGASSKELVSYTIIDNGGNTFQIDCASVK